MDNNKKYIQFLSGILLEGKFYNTITKKIGMPNYLADDMENRFEKYSIWVADSYKKYITKLLLEKVVEFEGHPNIKKPEIDFFFETGDEDFHDFLITWWQGKYRDELYGYVYDWLRGRNSGAVIETDKLNFKSMTAIEAYTKAVNWHRKLESIQTGIIEDEYGDVVITFPDGYYWIKLDSSKCEAEAKAMGHCGVGSKGGSLYSLRKDKKPVVTADVINGVVTQMRGKGNTKPKKEYYKYMTDFVMSDLVKSFEYNNYKSEDNFYVTDLEEKDIDNIISKKPSLMKNQNLEKIQEYQTKELLKTNPEIFPVKDIVPGDLSEENLRSHIKGKFEKGALDNFKLRNLLNNIKKSGKYFSKILVDEIEKSNLIFELIKYNVENYSYDSTKNNNETKNLIKIFARELPELEKYIKDLLLKDKDVISIFLKGNDYNKILSYLDVICLKSLFGKEGLNVAIKILQNPKIRPSLEKKVGKDYYKALESLVIDEIGDSPFSVSKLN